MSQPTAPNGAPLADFGTRLVARLLDNMIVGGVTGIVALPFIVVVMIMSVRSAEVAADGTVSTFSGRELAVVLLLELVFLPVVLVIQYLYEVEFTKRTGQTVGKRIMKLAVTPLDPARQIGRVTMVRRWLIISPAAIVPGFSLVDGIWQLWDQPYKQCLHDKFAGTVVVKVPG